MVNEQEKITQRNAAFWDELCGTHLAQSLGIEDSSPGSLKKFDDWFFDIYPYLYYYLPLLKLKGAKVMEVGLGYGSVAQKIGEAGATYSGLDIAKGPVEMANLRYHQAALSGVAVQGDALNMPFENESFDYVVALGCLHHTGDLQRAIDECYRVLKPGGTLISMVYYSYSFRRFVQDPITSIKYIFKEIFGYRGVIEAGTDKLRASSDANAAGEAAPHVDFISKKSIKYLCRNFKECVTTLENMNQESIYRFIPREKLLNTIPAKLWGLDLYYVCKK